MSKFYWLKYVERTKQDFTVADVRTCMYFDLYFLAWCIENGCMREFTPFKGK